MKNLFSGKFGSIALIACAASVTMLAGCDSGPRMKKFDIGLSQSSNHKVEVDLVCVPEAEKGKWERYDLDDYFSGNDSLRSGSTAFTKSYTFNEGDTKKISISTSDPIWNTWFKTRPYMFVLASSRTLRAEAKKINDPTRDPRRYPVTLTTEYFTASKFDITVSGTAIDVTPPPTKIVK